MAVLTSKGRKRLKKRSFAIPAKRKYPIQDRIHARAALQRVSQFGSAAEKKKVRRAVKRKYPSMQVSGIKGGKKRRTRRRRR